jgi:hypothetical protein
MAEQKRVLIHGGVNPTSNSGILKRQGSFCEPWLVMGEYFKTRFRP